MTKKQFSNAVSRLDIRKKNREQAIPGILGFMLNGEQTVEVPTRRGFVYVRLRNNTSEVIQAFNQEVAPVYGLPVLVTRDEVNNSQYMVAGRDLGVYMGSGGDGWGTSAYLPRHGATHSYRHNQPGGDIAWIYGRQFMPLLVYPSGSSGGPNVIIDPATYYQDSLWHYAGGTGTQDIIPAYKPTGSSARMVLVYLDNNGNPQLEGGGTYFAESITGASAIIPYLPALPDTGALPLGGVRLVSGTSAIVWANLYDLRPLIIGDGFIATGTFAPHDAEYVVISNSSELTDERVITAGAGIAITDGGAGSTVTISTTGSFDAEGTHLPIYDDSVFKVTGTAISFDDYLDVAVTGSIAYIKGLDRITGAGITGSVAVFNGPSSITGSSNFTWSKNMLLLDIPPASSWDSGKLPAFGIQSLRPAFGLYNDEAEDPIIFMFYVEGEEFRIAWSPYTADDWGYDNKVDLFTIYSALGWIGIHATNPTHPLTIDNDATGEWATVTGEAALCLRGETSPYLRLAMGMRTDTNVGRIQVASGTSTALDLALQPAGGNVGIGIYPTANMEGLSVEAGLLTLKERTTPTADADYGKVYTKSDNKLYFQDGAGVEHELSTPNTSGWLGAGETWTYGAMDDPTYTFTTTGNTTGTYSAGMRIKLTQTTDKYFIITKVVFDDPGSTITAYGGTDYDMVSGTITNPYYSSQKAPFGFPLEPDKWTVQASLTGTVQQLTPTGGTYYNLGSFSLNVPLGSWNVGYQVIGRVSRAAAGVSLSYRATLSKVNNAHDDNKLTATNFDGAASEVNRVLYSFFNRSKFITCTTKTSYYLLAFTDTASTDVIQFRGGSIGDTIIRAVCAYL